MLNKDRSGVSTESSIMLCEITRSGEVLLSSKMERRWVRLSLWSRSSLLEVDQPDRTDFKVLLEGETLARRTLTVDMTVVCAVSC